jgi:hypothetical protein
MPKFMLLKDKTIEGIEKQMNETFEKSMMPVGGVFYSEANDEFLQKMVRVKKPPVAMKVEFHFAVGRRAEEFEKNIRHYIDNHYVFLGNTFEHKGFYYQGMILGDVRFTPKDVNEK